MAGFKSRSGRYLNTVWVSFVLNLVACKLLHLKISNENEQELMGVITRSTLREILTGEADLRAINP